MNELDFEDLECQLYSQVYHGAPEEIEETTAPDAAPTVPNNPPTVPNDPPPAPNAMGKQSNRYFGVCLPGAKYQNQRRKLNSRRRNARKQRAESMYSKSCDDPRRPPAGEQILVVSPEKSFIPLNSKEKRTAQWKAQMHERVKQKRAEKRQSAHKESSVITLSDSDEDDSCILIDNNWPLLSVADSDDENVENNENQATQIIADKNEKSNIPTGEVLLKSEPLEAVTESLADDVIFVESAATPIEVISIDEENQEKNTEPASSACSNANPCTPSKDKTRQQQNERRELLNTPDSASNDFISNSEVELNQGGYKFNFSLHGSDFHSPGEFLKPAPRNETCETESSSSTTDANLVNLMKTAVFNEVDFPRDDIFSENNLESFGNFITPLRNNPVPNVQSSPVKASDGQNRSARSSDSSSLESDSEESQINRARESSAKSKQLPELSPMQKRIDVRISQLGKKSKKSTNMNSKYDLLNNLVDVSAQGTSSPKNSAKKKKRNKKRKSAIGAGDNTEDDGNNAAKNVSEIEITEGVGINEELRRKKRRSSQLENTETSENQSKKKMHSGNTEKNHEALKEKECSDSSPPVQPDSAMSDAVGADENEKRNADAAKEKIDSEERHMKVVTLEKNSHEIADEISKENANIDEVQAGSTSREADSNPILDGLTIVDETFDVEPSVVVISDSESALSHLDERPDIQLNLENSEDWHVSDAYATIILDSNRKGLDNCSVKDLQVDMSNDPNLWTILDSDRNPPGRSRGRRCNRCKQFGHIGIRCPNKVEVKCSLCGSSSHYEPRCPNKICTQCGQRSPYSTTYCGSCFKFRKSRCRICSMPGHLPNTCPDLWRRYHLTTNDGPPVPYDGPSLKERSQLWCSGCAQSGHLEYSCRFYKSIYPPTDPFIKSYADVYKKRTDNQESREERPMEQWVPHNRAPALLPAPLHPHAPMLRIPPFLQAQQVPNQISNYSINQLNDPMYRSFDDRADPGFAQNDFRQMNFVNPFHDRIFVANQQNFFPPGVANLVPYPENQQDDFAGNPSNFDNALPDFITLEPEVEDSTFRSYDEAPELPCNGRYFRNEESTGKVNRRRNAMFFSSTASELQQFLNLELSRLSKFSVATHKHIRELKKMEIRKRDGILKQTYFERVNMLLFGVLNMLEGKKHLERLKRFKLHKYNARVDNGTRNRLFNSYCYIFGRERIRGVPYHELLGTI